MSGRFPLISIITLNYNQSAVTVDFLKSSLDLTYPNYEILVCDMASSDNPGDIIHPEQFRNTRLLFSDKNLGFAAGNNWGMNQARGEYFFIVNNDTILTSDILERLLQPFLDHPRIGVTCPKILYHSAPDTIQYAGFAPMNRYTGRTLAIGDHEKDRGQHNQPGPTAGAHGCAMLVKREVAEDTGRFPEKFFLYYEEWDWSARLLKKGYQIWYTADARIYHKESMSVGKANPMKLYYLTRNRILYMRRNSSGFPLWVFTAFFICFSLPKTSFLFLVRGQFAHLRNFLKGALWNLNHDTRSPL